MALIQSPSTIGNIAEVDSDKCLTVSTTKDATKAGYSKLIDSEGNPIVTTENGFLKVSSANVQFFDQVDGSAINTNLYDPRISNMTIGQASGYWTLNSGQAVTANAYAIMQSNKFMPLYGTLPLIINFTAKVLNVPEANGTIELGLGAVGTNVAPTDGAFFRWTPSGQFVCVLNNGGVETLSSAITPPTTTVNHLYEIEIVEDHVVFAIDDVDVADIPTAAGQAYPFNAGHQQVVARVYNSGSSPSLAPVLAVGQVTVVQEDMNQAKTWDETVGQLGRGAYQLPVTDFSQTANHANSASPTSATLSNTAAGYTTLGGKWQFAALSGAATDYALFAFQIPAGYQLVVRSISISSANTGVAGSLTVPTVLDWSVGVNSSGVSLATANAAASSGTPGTWAPRRIPLGIQSFPTTSLLGAQVSDITRRFDTPIVVDSGRYFHIILQVPAGAATGSQVIRGDVFVNGYFE